MRVSRGGGERYTVKAERYTDKAERYTDDFDRFAQFQSATLYRSNRNAIPSALKVR
jgi:hypothetical protein